MPLIEHDHVIQHKGKNVDEVAWAKNRTKSKVRAKVEHEVSIRESTLPRTEEEWAPAVRYLCAGESVYEPQKYCSP
jgi:hypothetical protein